MKTYTFSTLGRDNERYYPKRRCKFVGAGLTDFEWTTDIKRALCWEHQDPVETIAICFSDSQIIEITGTISKIYTIIKELA